ncbi:MAG: DUF5665 domain-containing protein [Paracoccaceae bacterium]
MTDKSKIPAERQTDVAGLRRELERLNSHKFIRVHNSLPRLMWYQFLRGLAMGLGTVVGATFLVSVLVLLLAKIDFIPIIGDWAAQIADQISSRP